MTGARLYRALKWTMFLPITLYEEWSRVSQESEARKEAANRAYMAVWRRHEKTKLLIAERATFLREFSAHAMADQFTAMFRSDHHGWQDTQNPASYCGPTVACAAKAAWVAWIGERYGDEATQDALHYIEHGTDREPLPESGYIL